MQCCYPLELLHHRGMPNDSVLRGVLISAAGPQMRDVLYDLALPSFRSYAQAWGYAVHAVDLPADGACADPAAQDAKWAKIALLREALMAYPLAVWLDADILVLRTDEDIATHLHPAHFQALALEQVPSEHRINPNTGVWVLRSCPAAFDFLDNLEKVGAQPGPWADQGAVLAALGWERGDRQYRWARPGVGNRFLTRTSWLPTGWNQPYLEQRHDGELYNGSADSYADRPSVARPHALHFMGMTPAARYQRMGEVARDTRTTDYVQGRVE
jgi:galactosyl transferase GMA12/MNN10 family